MTRSGRSARLASHLPEPFVDMHAGDALLFGAREGTPRELAHDLHQIGTPPGGVDCRCKNMHILHIFYRKGSTVKDAR